MPIALPLHMTLSHASQLKPVTLLMAYDVTVLIYSKGSFFCIMSLYYGLLVTSFSAAPCKSTACCFETYSQGIFHYHNQPSKNNTLYLVGTCCVPGIVQGSLWMLSHLFYSPYHHIINVQMQTDSEKSRNWLSHTVQDEGSGKDTIPTVSYLPEKLQHCFWGIRSTPSDIPPHS